VRIQGSVIIVTGGSSGIGEATARELAQRGAHLVLAARRMERLGALASTLNAVAVETDVARVEDRMRLVATTVERFGRIDVLINNAGTGSGRSFLRDSDDAIQHLVAVNLLAPILLTRAAVPHMPRGGVIVNVGSLAGEGPPLNLYAVSKTAMNAFTHGLRLELAPRGIGAVLIEPGFIRTELTAGVRLPVPVPGPDVVATAIARAIERPRNIVIVPTWYVPLVWAMRLTPRPLMELAVRLGRPKSR
jgi:NAD(P)-dependent dehydrogenase (short-subunit alcohol dehydrogenase family)